jgi:hypothetical protein
VWAKIAGQNVHIMLDIGATGNFIDPHYIKVSWLTLWNKAPYVLGGLGKNNIGIVSKETEILEVIIQGQWFKEKFDIISMDTYNVVLGTPWFK